MKTKRIVECDVCGIKYAFIVPCKLGVYRIACPRCKKEIRFKVITQK